MRQAMRRWRLGRRALLAGFTTLALLPTAALAGHVARQGDGDVIHWSDGTNPRAYVYFVDHTGPAWPVFASAIRWDEHRRVDVVYRSAGSGCPSHCLDIRTTRTAGPCRGGSILYGFVVYDTRPGGHLTGRTRMRFNRRCRRLSRGHRRELTCHEEGHGVGGLNDERPHSANSCMRTGRINRPLERQPDRHDFRVLREIVYDHND